ncbi:hypothetical protein [Pusillimonas minor]|uniref:Uncharacterized protein n=1 Tax=Pusillimonas minor TaxID=2697024 RepID=A0A842HJL6_9BURK|nr:hypothetical protein [Pusillimonas minor]MBC2768413.1 hypothetical protein [Pusillimonas minor]
MNNVSKASGSRFSQGGAARFKRGARLSRGAILADIFLVALWGATIPGLMWLGAAGGF